MSVTFRNTIVSIDGTKIYANEARISESLSIDRVPSLGYIDSINDVYSDKPVGEFSATYFLQNNDSAIRNKIITFDDSSFIDGEIGENYGFTDGIITSYSLSAEPQSLVKASITIVFFQEIGVGSSRSAITSLSSYAHGLNSALSSVSSFFSDNLFSFEYSISRSVSPIYFLGKTSISDNKVVDFTQGSVEVSLEGNGLGGSITYPCLSKSNVTISLKDICGDAVGSDISVTDLNVISSDLTLSDTDGLIGSVRLSKTL